MAYGGVPAHRTAARRPTVETVQRMRPAPSAVQARARARLAVRHMPACCLGAVVQTPESVVHSYCLGCGRHSHVRAADLRFLTSHWILCGSCWADETLTGRYLRMAPLL